MIDGCRFYNLICGSTWIQPLTEDALGDLGAQITQIKLLLHDHALCPSDGEII
jgi:hypothetical protein